MADASMGDLRGLGVPDPRWIHERLKDRGTGSTDSSYTEASPIAGTPEPADEYDMVLRASGTPSQRAHIRLRCERAGMPGLDRGGFVWDDQTAATPAWYGWETPALVTGWETLNWVTAAASWHTPIPHVIRLSGGTLLAVHSQQNNVAKTLKVSSYSPATSAWTTVNVLLDDAAEQKGPSLVELPDGGVLLFVQSSDDQQVDAYLSEDAGATFAIYARRVLGTVPGTADIREVKAAYSAGEILLVVAYRDGSSNRTAATYYSGDLGCSFAQVEDDWRTTTTNTEDPESFCVLPADGGGFIVAYADNDGTGTAPFRARSVGSAAETPANYDAVSFGVSPAQSFASLSVWRDEVGTLFAMFSDNTADSVAGVERSVDGGATWAPLASLLHTGLALDSAAGFTGANDFDVWACASVGGRSVALCRWVAATADEDDRSIGVIWLGGHSSVTAPYTDAPVGVDDRDQIAYSKRTAGGGLGGIYLPVQEPQLVTWTATGAGGEDLVSPGGLEVDTAGNTRYYSRTITGVDKLWVEIIVDLDSGDGSLSASDIGLHLRLANASSYEYEVHLRLAHTGYAVYDDDAGAKVGTDATVSLTSRLHIRVAMDKGNIRTWHSTGGHSRSWTAGPTGTIDDAGATANESLISWGHFTSTTETSRWALLGYCGWPGTWGSHTTDFAAAWTSPDDLHPRSFSTEPALVHDGISAWAVDGPAKIGDTWAIKQDSEYSAGNLFWDVAPSPARPWRSVDDEAACSFVVDLSQLTTGDYLSSCLFVALLGCNFNRADFERWDGAAWQTIATIQANDGLTGLHHQRYGDVIEPLKGGAAHTAARYLIDGDLVGGTAKLSGSLRRIVRNTSGAWTSQTAAIPACQLRDVVNGDATSGTLELWAPSVAAVITEHTATNRLYRVTIPAQATADDYFECGQIVVGSVHVFGRQYSRGYSVTESPTVDVRDLVSGSSRAVRRGPSVREIEIGWPDGDDASPVQAASPVPHYLSGSTSGIALASPGQTLRALQGLVRQLGGAATPVVYLGRIERSSGATTIANPRQFLYGRVLGDVVRTNVLGDEQASELDRGDSIRIREIT